MSYRCLRINAQHWYHCNSCERYSAQRNSAAAGDGRRVGCNEHAPCLYLPSIKTTLVSDDARLIALKFRSARIIRIIIKPPDNYSGGSLAVSARASAYQGPDLNMLAAPAWPVRAFFSTLPRPSSSASSPSSRYARAFKGRRGESSSSSLVTVRTAYSVIHTRSLSPGYAATLARHYSRHASWKKPPGTGQPGFIYSLRRDFHVDSPLWLFPLPGRSPAWTLGKR